MITLKWMNDMLRIQIITSLAQRILMRLAFVSEKTKNFDDSLTQKRSDEIIIVNKNVGSESNQKKITRTTKVSDIPRSM